MVLEDEAEDLRFMGLPTEWVRARREGGGMLRGPWILDFWRLGFWVSYCEAEVGPAETGRSLECDEGFVLGRVVLLCDSVSRSMLVIV